MKHWFIAPALATAIALAFVPNARAGAARLILESDVNMGAGAEFAQMSYASVADLIANNPTSSQFTQLDLNAVYSLADIAYEGGAYRFLFESDTDEPGGNELFLATYDSWADVLSDTLSSIGPLPQNVNQFFDIHGFTYDGAAYRLLGESNFVADGNLGIISYATLADLLAGTNRTVQSLELNLADSVSVAGLGFDNGVYRLLLESDVDSGGGSELSLISYANFADFVANNPTSSQFLPQDIPSGYSVNGFEFDTNAIGPGPGVPEPATWAMMIMGFGLIGGALRRRKATGRASVAGRGSVSRRLLQAPRLKRWFTAPTPTTAIAGALKNVGVAFALCALATAAQAAVVTFDTAPFGAPFAPHTEDGFTVSTHSGFLFNSDFGNPGNDLEAKLYTDGGVAAFVAANGSLFTFTRLDYSLFTGFGSGFVTLSATGFRDGIAVGTESYALGFNHNQFKYTDWNTFQASNLAGIAIDELQVALKLGSVRGVEYFQAIDNVTFGEAAGPGPGVPEPATWAMMIIGFGAVGGALRRRRATEGLRHPCGRKDVALRGRLGLSSASIAACRPTIVP